MFNCGEGACRVFRENEINVAEVFHVFVTHKEWKKMSGLPDLYMSLQNKKKKKITFHGPPYIEDFFGVTASYHKNVAIVKKPLENEVYTDWTMEVQYVPIYSVSVPFHSRNKLSLSSKQQKIKEIVPEGSDVAVSYICKCASRPRELSLEKCIELGVSSGPLLLELKNGNDVTLPSGKKVLCKDVLALEDPNIVFLVVDCPSESFLDSFVNEEKFRAHQTSSSEHQNIAAVVHFTPPDIFDSYMYQKWISRFPSDTVHMVLNSRNPIPSRPAVQDLQQALHNIHPRVFKSLPKTNSIVDRLSDTNIIQAEEGLIFHLRPSKYFSHNTVAKLEKKSYVKRAKESLDFKESLSKLHLRLQEEEKKQIGSNYPEVIFLGTGSAYSSAYRSTSSILINISCDQSVMFDCGEETYRRLVQYFGLHEVKSVLKRISCVFISHHHTDHYMGLFELIKARKEALYSSSQKYTPLIVTIPYLLYKVFDNFEKLFGPIRSDIRIFLNSNLNFKPEEPGNNLNKYLGDVEFLTVPVQHCADSHGAVLSSGSKWKLVYSGDCSPTQSLIDAGKDCTLLIHEATVEDELVNQATLQRHSTVSQALDVAQQMNAKYTIVTHFSCYYVEVPLIKDCYKNQNVGIAFDNMRVRLCDLPCLPLFIPSLKCLFSERIDLHHMEAIGNAGFEAVTLKALKS